MLKWDAVLDKLQDRRKQGRIPTPTIVRAVLVMCLCRLGSLNALSHTRRSKLWRQWLGQDLPSADTLGRVASLVDLEGIRMLQRHLYARLKLGKALSAPLHGFLVAVLDGHETHATYKRCCPGCLQRTVHTASGDRIQYYHRVVALSLITKDLRLLLDAEPILPGEDEVAAAIRLLDRVYRAYPRAFDVVQGDGLYTDPRFFRWAIDHGKYVTAVLKNERRDLFQDAVQLFAEHPPATVRDTNTLRECWDLEGFTTWPQVKTPVRVVRSRETRTVLRQLDGQSDQQISDWYWVTTLPQRSASTGVVVNQGHQRWDIENYGFNEMVNRYHADHVYRHEPNAMLVFWLLTQFSLNVFTVFFWRNLKPAARIGVSMAHVAEVVKAELYLPPARAPT